MSARFDPRYIDRVHLTTPAYASGTVDVSVTNRDRKTAVAANACTFAAPETFAVDGDWEGVAGHENFELRIVGGAIVSLACWTSGAIAVSPPARITGGEFSFSRIGISLSGRIVAPTEAIGFVTVDQCLGWDWYANPN